MQFFSNEKEAVSHRKFLKRFFKIFVTNLIEMYPEKKKILPLIIDKVCILAQCKIRLIRYGFTVIAMGLTKVLLN
jgi:hypothetical protein